MELVYPSLQNKEKKLYLPPRASSSVSIFGFILKLFRSMDWIGIKLYLLVILEYISSVFVMNEIVVIFHISKHSALSTWYYFATFHMNTPLHLCPEAEAEHACVTE